MSTTLLATITLAGIAWIAGLPEWLGIPLFSQQYVAFFWALALSSVFLLAPARKSAPRNRVPWYDWVCFTLSISIGLYVAIDFERIFVSAELAEADTWAPALIVLLLLVEATRRMTSAALLWLLLIFVVYAYFADALPGLLLGNSVSFERLMVYLYFDNNGLLGIPMRVVASVLLAFILLGNILFATGGSQFFTGLAIAGFGRYRGGAAKVSVVASTLFGTISGSAVSNVVTTGVVTIPMMKNNGYRAEVSGAIEAVASTGGQITPPVMGAIAFIMAEFLGITYGEIVIAAIVPAALYYILVFVQVDLEAARAGLAGWPKQDIPRFIDVMRAGWIFIVPLALLIYTLMELNFPPGRAGLTAAVSIFVLIFLFPKTRPTGQTVWRIVVGTGRNMLDIAVLGAVASVVIGTLNVSGLAFNLATFLTELGGQSVFLLLVLAAVLCIIMGMGMPTANVYLLLAVLIAPGLIRLDLPPLAVHMFILYFGMMSMLTPPVAIGAFAAASIAEADPIRTAFQSVRLGAMAYIVPFVFVYSPELLLIAGTTAEQIWTIGASAIGAVIFAVALAGYLTRELGLALRSVLFAAAFACFVPHDLWSGAGYLSNAAGAVAGLALIAFESRRSR